MIFTIGYSNFIDYLCFFIDKTMMANLKKTFFVLFFTLMCGLVFGQDIIITKAGKKIEARVTAINVDRIQYELYYLPNKPVYSMLKSEIASILYQNGTVQTFDIAPRSPQSSPNPSSNSSYRSDGIYDKYLSLQIMKDNEQEQYLQLNHPELYRRFHTGQNLSRAGRSLLIPGGIIFAGGLGLLIAGAVDYNEDLLLAGAIAFTAGNTIILVSIPLSAVGGGLKKSVQNEYKRKYLGTTHSKGQFQLQLSGNGIGLAYVF